MAQPKALVLGGYGLIGSACMSALARDGFDVRGVGRSAVAAERCDASADWVTCDLTQLTADGWADLLEGVDVVVNAAGALQDGAEDNLSAIHVTMIAALLQAAAQYAVRIVQISAAGVAEDASTAFLRTKAAGDALVTAYPGEWAIVRPVLVLSPDAYGGTALLRAGAAMPEILPAIYPKAQVQTVHVDDVAASVVAAANGQVPSGTIADLTEADRRPLPELMKTMRQWQGYPPARFHLAIPGIVLRPLAGLADLLGYLGWRSPLRSTALRVLRHGVTGDPQPWRAAGGPACRSLEDSLRALPATRQERLYARAYLALPVAIATLSVFWVATGLVALSDVPRAMSVLTDRDMAHLLAAIAVIGGLIADIGLGLAILVRHWARGAAVGMIALSKLYLLGSLLLAPDLWTDPMGPMVKVIPGIALAFLVWIMLEDR